MVLVLLGFFVSAAWAPFPTTFAQAISNAGLAYSEDGGAPTEIQLEWSDPSNVTADGGRTFSRVNVPLIQLGTALSGEAGNVTVALVCASSRCDSLSGTATLVGGGVPGQAELSATRENASLIALEGDAGSIATALAEALRYDEVGSQVIRIDISNGEKFRRFQLQSAGVEPDAGVAAVAISQRVANNALGRVLVFITGTPEVTASLPVCSTWSEEAPNFTISLTSHPYQQNSATDLSFTVRASP